MTLKTKLNVSTALTEKFGCRLPIVAGGLMWLSDANYVSACANAGIMSFITAASFPDASDLRQEIRTCFEKSNGFPFGVNVSMLPKLVEGENIADVFRLIADEGVKFIETSGRNPEEFMPLLKELGFTVLHKLPSVRFALKAQSIGVDMVSIVGAECGGHPGLDLTGSMVNLALAEQKLDIPFLIGGGIGSGSQVIAALASGASGVVIGTRFLVAHEINAHLNFKLALVNANERDTELTMQSVRNTVRTLKNETTEKVKQLEISNPNVSIKELMPFVSGKIAKQAYQSGDVSKGMLSAGQSLGLIHEIQSIADIIAQLESEADIALNRLNHLTGCATTAANIES